MVSKSNKRKAPVAKEDSPKQRKVAASQAKKAPAKRAASPTMDRSASPAPKKAATATTKKSSASTAPKARSASKSPSRGRSTQAKGKRGYIENDIVQDRPADHPTVSGDVRAWNADEDSVHAKKSTAKSRSPSPAKTRSRSGTKTTAKSKTRSPSPAPKKQSKELSPGWETVKSKKAKKAEKKAQAPKTEEMPVEKSGASKSRSRSRSSTGGALASTENFRNETAIDDEQYIQYYFRTGIMDQWSRTVAMLAGTIAPLFVAIPMYCYLRGDRESAQIGVTFVVIYALIVALSILVGLPAVLVQRVTISTLTGTSPSKSSELEVLCLLLFVLTGVSLMITMRMGGYIVWPF
jgi:hypothetical protein